MPYPMPGISRLAMLSHQAGGEPSEPAIAEGGVRLGPAHAVEIDAKVAERAVTVSVSRRFPTTSANSRPIRNSNER